MEDPGISECRLSASEGVVWERSRIPDAVLQCENIKTRHETGIILRPPGSVSAM